MAAHRYVGDLEVSQNLRAQRREWIAERVGWAVILVVTVGALLGLFGRGWLSTASIGGADGALRLRYERFTRLFSATALTVVLDSTALHDDTARVWIDRDLMQSVQMMNIVPRPQRVVAAPDRFTYLFPLSAPRAPITITFHVQPQHPWWHAGWIGVPAGHAVHISQFVYP